MFVFDMYFELIVWEIIDDMFVWLEWWYGKVLVSYVLVYVIVFLNGLIEFELEDIFLLDDDVLNDVY